MASGTDLIPAADSTSDLGTSANRFQTIYVDSIVGANVAFDVEARAAGTTISSGTDFALITSANGGIITLPSPTAGKSLYVKLSSSVGDAVLTAAANTLVENSASIRLESTGSAVQLIAYDTQSWFIL